MFSAALVRNHDAQDFLVSLCHTVTAQTSNTGDHVLYALLYNTVSADKLLAFLIHLIAQDTVVNCQCNLACAGCLGTVTYNTGSNSKSIYKCMDDSIQVSALEVSNTTAGSSACIDCAAVCAKTADGGLLMDS